MPGGPKVLLLYVPVGSQQEAEQIATVLLSEKLIACANILPPHTAIYSWEGKIERSSEHIMILKTQPTLKEKLMKRVEELHPYDTPCVLALSETEANQAFGRWVESETKIF